MFEALEVMERSELDWRYARARRYMDEVPGGCDGLMVFSRVWIYYFSGTLAVGAFWLPREGEPVLFVRKGVERAKLESPLPQIESFRSYSDLLPVMEKLELPLPKRVAVEQGGLSWGLGQLLASRLKGCEFLPGDMVIAKTQAVKSPWELSKLRLAGARHNQALYELLPKHIKPGMSEREISHKTWEVFFSLGHHGMMRMSNHGEEVFLGHIAAGDSGIYPSFYNGPVGLRGEHPAFPFMGSAGKVWLKGQPLTIDAGFALEGYHSDKTQVYFAGQAKDIPAEMARAHDFCIEVQNYAAKAMTPGAIPSQIYAKSLEMAEKAGLSEGFMGLEGNKVTFLGHGIGLAIDCWPVFAKGFDAPLEEGVVMALEPKYGLPGLGMVGVENTFEVTDKGGICITGTSYEMICLE